MATELEILNADENSINVAFYYAVPVNLQLAGANDQTREPAGTKLSAQELQDLKDGTLFEFVRHFKLVGSTISEMQSHILQKRADYIALAAAKYKSLYDNKQYVGYIHDGTSWSNP